MQRQHVELSLLKTPFARDRHPELQQFAVDPRCTQSRLYRACNSVQGATAFLAFTAILALWNP
jgi:hypothetical protein